MERAGNVCLRVPSKAPRLRFLFYVRFRVVRTRDLGTGILSEPKGSDDPGTTSKSRFLNRGRDLARDLGTAILIGTSLMVSGW